MQDSTQDTSISSAPSFEASTAEFMADANSRPVVDPGVGGIEALRCAASELQRDHTNPVPAGVQQEDRRIPGRDGDIAIRIYRQEAASTRAPVLVYIHGGAWTLYGLDDYDGVCGYLCAHAGMTVVSVDYRLAPEHKFPAAVEDCMDAVAWVYENIEAIGGLPGAVSIAGDSAGANLTAVVCQQARANNGPRITRQILLYPAVSPFSGSRFASRKKYGGGEYFLDEAGVQFMLDLYRRSAEDDQDPRLWPALTEDLTGLPEAYIVTAEFDMLRDEAWAYAERLKDAGVQVMITDYKNTIHGFMANARTIKPGLRALNELCAYLCNHTSHLNDLK